MFDSPDESEKRLRDFTDSDETGVRDFETLSLKEFFPDDKKTDESEIVQLLDDIADSDADDYTTESFVVAQNFDLNLASDNDIRYDEELDSFGEYGYNLDQYLEQFPASGARLYKGLLKITKEFGTHAGALIKGEDVVVNLAVGDSIVKNIMREIYSGSCSYY